ncbi:MAG TPA: signal peptidase II [Candidatus Elarobacter sp.]|nr:signal peptidase II [Candidatus Elarobacter sp.]
MPSVPQPGDEIYVETYLHLSHGVDDVRGGRATVTRVVTDVIGGRGVPFVEVAEHPDSLYNWEDLAEKQTGLAAQFGEARARVDPDMRPQFNDDMMTEDERRATYETVPGSDGAPPSSRSASSQRDRATAAALTLSVVAAIVFLLDRWSKDVVLRGFLPGESRPVIPHLLWWTYVQNQHGAFGMFGDSPVLLIVLAVIVLGIFAYSFRDAVRRSRIVRVAFGMIVGGAIGNIVDRFQHRWVVDFIDFRTIWPNVFNVADACITIGVALLVIESLRRGESRRRTT